MNFLSAAASNAASIEDKALRAGRKEGGAAKGELVLAIFELANSFRQGWGVKKDPVAAKQVRADSSKAEATETNINSITRPPWVSLIPLPTMQELQSLQHY